MTYVLSNVQNIQAVAESWNPQLTQEWCKLYTTGSLYRVLTWGLLSYAPTLIRIDSLLVSFPGSFSLPFNREPGNDASSQSTWDLICFWLPAGNVLELVACGVLCSPLDLGTHKAKFPQLYKMLVPSLSNTLIFHCIEKAGYDCNHFLLT